MQKADEEAAKVYEEFVESFKGDEGGGQDGNVKAFVRGGVVAPGSRSHEATGASACMQSTQSGHIISDRGIPIMPCLLPVVITRQCALLLHQACVAFMSVQHLGDAGHCCVMVRPVLWEPQQCPVCGLHRLARLSQCGELARSSHMQLVCRSAGCFGQPRWQCLGCLHVE